MFRIILFIAVIGIFVVGIQAQTTEFTYQGSLKDGASPANGNYDLEFRLFNLASGGSQQGTTVQRLNVAVADGIFTVTVDFGVATLPGADRFLNIAVRTAGGGAFTTLTPRQPLASTPYAIRSLNAASADTVVNIPSGSGNYIQNGASVQATSNFNISGNGTASGTLSGGVVNATTQYNIGANRILSNAGTFNLFAGVGAGSSNSGNGNTFVGSLAGLSNTTGISNTFFGARSGQNNTTGGNNAFFGADAGRDGVSGSFNAFFGNGAGTNSTADGNALFGFFAGLSNTIGSGNAFFGQSVGLANTTGSNNSFFGKSAGSLNTAGSNNTVIGYDSDVGSGNLSFATAIGSGSIVPTSNMVRLGRTSDTVSAPGTLIVGNSVVQRGNVDFYSNAGNMDLYLQAFGATTGVNFGVNSGPNLFISHYDGTTYQNRIILTPTGTVRILTLGAAGATQLCHNATSELATCSSSLKYKNNIGNFLQGLSFINKLRPISFDWKDGGMMDVGFGAEDIAKIDPRFVTYNNKGEVEGVKYDRLSVAFVNAFKEQQSQIDAQQKEIAERKETEQRLQSQIDELKKIVCSLKPNGDRCDQEDK